MSHELVDYTSLDFSLCSEHIVQPGYKPQPCYFHHPSFQNLLFALVQPRSYMTGCISQMKTVRCSFQLINRASISQYKLSRVVPSEEIEQLVLRVLCTIVYRSEVV